MTCTARWGINNGMGFVCHDASFKPVSCVGYDKKRRKFDSNKYLEFQLSREYSVILCLITKWSIIFWTLLGLNSREVLRRPHWLYCSLLRWWWWRYMIFKGHQYFTYQHKRCHNRRASFSKRLVMNIHWKWLQMNCALCFLQNLIRRLFTEHKVSFWSENEPMFTCTRSQKFNAIYYSFHVFKIFQYENEW